MSKETESENGVRERWSAKAKADVVLRLLRGERMDAVSREIQVPAHEIETWRRDFLDGGRWVCGVTGATPKSAY